MWTWTCTGCGGAFDGATREEAQQRFFDHVTEAHPEAAVFSTTIPEGVR